MSEKQFIPYTYLIGWSEALSKVPHTKEWNEKISKTLKGRKNVRFG